MYIAKPSILANRKKISIFFRNSLQPGTLRLISGSALLQDNDNRCVREGQTGGKV